MAVKRRTLVLVALAGAACRLRHHAFVPGPVRRSASVAVPVAVAAAGAAPALADEIGDAAKKLSDASYPFLKETNWGSYIWNLKPGEGASAADWAKAVDKAIEMGAAMDPKLLKAGVQAHHKAIGSLSPSNLVLSKADYEAINAAIGRMVASVPESKTMDVYNSFSALVSPDVPPYLMSTVNEADAKKAYAAFLEFKDVVKAHPITPSVPETPAALSGKLGAIDAAAEKLSKASYPFIQSVDWASDLWNRPLPGASAYEATKAIDKMLVMGASMDGKLLKEAAEAHHKALQGMDSKLVATEADYTAVNAALGKVIASVPQSQVMDVFNSMSKLVNPNVPQKIFSTVAPLEAVKSYDALLTFTNTVKAAQR